MIRALLVVCALAAAADADVWQRASDPGASDAYDAALAEGDRLAVAANARAQSATNVARVVDAAIEQYKLAAKARPTAGEPYFRIASVLESYFTDCPTFAYRQLSPPPPTCPTYGGRIDLRRADQTVAAWVAFEKLAPLDPRVSDALFARAILRTKLVQTAKNPTPLLEGALADYRALLDRADGMTLSDPAQVWGNLAETYMMLGRMEEAIDAYRYALRNGATGSTAYGLAVALDRDGSPAEALEVILQQSEREFTDFRAQVARGSVFFVPAGEEYYYLALIYEAFDKVPQAMEFWRAFIKSGAHPAFQPRAKQHLDALQVKLKALPKQQQRIPLEIDLF